MTTTIIGAGLSGLACAYQLHQANLDVVVLEANNVAGGRIQPAIKNTDAVEREQDERGHQDLGPTWVWPYAQPTVTQWVEALSLTLFDQYEQGAGLLDKHADTNAQAVQLPSQYGSERIVGGTYALIKALTNKLPDNTIRYGQAVTQCEQQNNQWQLTVKTANAQSQAIYTDQLIVATPPRLASTLFNATDKQLTQTLNTLSRTETWMAPHAKVVAMFDTPFWREQGLSGRVASQVGPLVEIHDHCGPDGTPAALFGFAGVPAHIRAESAEEFKAAIQAQLIRCFGEQAAKAHILIKDWAFEPYTSTQADIDGTGAHPQVLDQRVRASHCDNTLWFAGSEVAAVSAGLIEGALARANEVAQLVTTTLKAHR